MRTLRHAGLAVLGLVLAGGAAMAPPAATIPQGPVTGKVENGAEAFLGLPYARPPVGDLRWRAPQPADGWSRPFEATRFANDCAQKPFPSDAAPLGTEPSEDCLYLNVWRPEGASSGDRLPVMVWIHGGGFINGGASPDVYDGAALAREGMVVVSLNYRLGRFGFFAHPALSADAADEERGGNYGILDQAMALSWVQDNIAAFGGNPAQVTVMGESAGGRSVHLMLTSPLTEGMVQRAVIQSGGDGGSAMSASLDAAREAALAFAEGKGITGTGPGAAKALRALEEDAVVDGLNLSVLFERGSDAPPDFHMPVLDDVVVLDTAEAYRSGRLAGMPVMIGATSADIGGPDGVMLRGARQLAALMTAQDMPVWHYVYDYVAESERSGGTAGAPHASEIPFFFGTVAAKYEEAATDLDRSASGTALGYLASFVKTGDPNTQDLPEWPRYGEAGTTLVFTRDGSAAVADGR